jgi:hypothetical protein
METATTPIVLKYDATNLGKFKSTTHYQFKEVLNGTLEDTDLTELLNLSKDRECAKSSPTYWAQVRINKKWHKPRLTGLFKTEFQEVYKGDTEKGRNKVIFKFLQSKQELTIYYFKDLYYPNFYKEGLNRFKNILQYNQ